MYQGLGNIPSEFDVPVVRAHSLIRMSATFQKDNSLLLRWFVDGAEAAKFLVPADAASEAVFPVIGLECSAEVISGGAPTDEAQSW